MQPLKKPPRSQSGSLGMTGWLVAMHRELPGYLWPILGFSLVSNLLLLVSPLYMLQVYDRILTSGSTDTLIWITLISVFLMSIYAAAETGRRRLCGLAAEHLDEMISERVFKRFDEDPKAGADLPGDLRVLSKIRGFFQNQTILPFFDLPFAPFFLMVMFLIHPIIGVLGLIGGLVLLSVAVTAELTNRDDNEQASRHSSEAFSLATGLARQRSAIVSMGLTESALLKWRAAKAEARDFNLKAGAKEGGFTSITRAGRQTLQILILGAGGALAISQQISPGAIVAGSIILSRALGPIDQIVGSWRGIAAARGAWKQLGETIQMERVDEGFTPLPRPEPVLEMTRLSAAFPGAELPLIRPFGLKVSGGRMIAIMGENGCGKTTLLQTLAGAYTPHAGHVSLGGRDLHKWKAEDRGQYVGYVPQTVELLPGTVGENIARMQKVDASDIIAAAQKVGAHEMILRLPQGYETPVGVPGVGGLSAGQRQLVGLARAAFGNPVVILLDEPTANLDPKTTYQAISHLNRMAQDGTIIIAATHDMKLVQVTQTLLDLRDGAVMAADTQQYLAAARSRTNPQKQAASHRLHAVGDAS